LLSPEVKQENAAKGTGAEKWPGGHELAGSGMMGHGALDAGMS